MSRRAVLSLIAALALVAAAVAGWRARGSAPPPSPHASDPRDVPAQWRQVRDSRGHQVHVVAGALACDRCHTGAGFTSPGAEACGPTCHRQEPSLHPTHPLGPSPVPTCLDCHRFGAAAAPDDPSRACMSCHARAQGLTVAAVGIHAPPAEALADDVLADSGDGSRDEPGDRDGSPRLAAPRPPEPPPCKTCHAAHQRPSIDAPSCGSCHRDQAAVRHGDLRGGCADCHSVHQARGAAADRCVQCHARPRDARPPRVDPARALFEGHPACSSCHAPHRFDRAGAASCQGCHEKLAVLGGDGPSGSHRCQSCHDPHQPGQVRACTSCHAGGTQHRSASALAPTGGAGAHASIAGIASTAGIASNAGNAACTGCHPIHAPPAALSATRPIAVACATCHPTVASHAPAAACASCHPPHGAPAPRGSALCATCHLERARSTAATGHADCVTCHVQPGHEPRRPPPACESCHAPIAAAVRPGHRACAQCHQRGEHAPRQLAACATCHAEEARTAPAGHADCATCHAPHDGALRPAASCATCHADRQRGHGATSTRRPPWPAALALRDGAGPLTCTSCHRAHGGPGLPTAVPPCATCHRPERLPALHRSHVPPRAACASCHLAHDATGKSDRATCLSCHQDRKDHEPRATSCAACHPFAP